MAGDAQEAGPGLLLRLRMPADEAGDVGIGPHAGVVGEVLSGVAAQDQAFGFEAWNVHAGL